MLPRSYTSGLRCYIPQLVDTRDPMDTKLHAPTWLQRFLDWWHAPAPVACPGCGGEGEIDVMRPVSPTDENGGMTEECRSMVCRQCAGTGRVEPS